MKYRTLSPTGDYQLGRSGLFFIDTPEAVAQAVRTRLLLVSGEWFLDSTEGTPYPDQVLGTHTQAVRDIVLRSRVLDTVGVSEITNYYSTVVQRAMSVHVTLTTAYGVTKATTEV
jgi:hypothetical protein